MVSGTMEAPDQNQLFGRLERSGHVPIRIEEAGSGGRNGSAGKVGTGWVATKHLVPFTRQMSTLVRAGIPILSALDALWQQTQDETLRAVTKSVSHDIQGGMTLSRALGRHPKAFSSFMVNTVAAGEAGGVLGDVLEGLADFMEHQAKTRSDIRGAMVYPAAMVVILFGAIGFLSAFVVPRFTKLFGRFKTDLPMPTQVLIVLSNAVRGYWWLIAGVVVLATVLIIHYVRTPGGRMVFDRMKLKMPVFGHLFVASAMHRFSQMMSLLTRSGLPLLQTLEVASRTIGNEVVAKDVREMKESIGRGNNLAGAMRESENFTPLTRNMIAIGEKTGSNEKMFQAVSDHYDMELKAIIRNMTTLIQPILTVVLAGFALFLALSIFLPMWDMIKLFKGGSG